MADNDIHVYGGGALQKSKPPSPRSIKAQSQARDSLVRLIIGGIVVGILAVAYVIVLWNKLEGSDGLLALLASSLGYLFGRERTPSES